MHTTLTSPRKPPITAENKIILTIQLRDAGKRFNKDWVFRNLDYTFSPTERFAITGSNGSGKSTLLQSLAGYAPLSEGSAEYGIEAEKLYASLSIAAPYLELVEEFTGKEMVRFHQKFKPLKMGVEAILSLVGLKNHGDKYIKYYSSGMKQRLKLALAFFSDTPLMLLDEPCSNLDAEGMAVYHECIQQQPSDRLIIISSNVPEEYSFCGKVLHIADYKPVLNQEEEY